MSRSIQRLNEIKDIICSKSHNISMDGFVGIDITKFKQLLQKIGSLER